MLLPSEAEYFGPRFSGEDDAGRHVSWIVRKHDAGVKLAYGKRRKVLSRSSPHPNSLYAGREYCGQRQPRRVLLCSLGARSVVADRHKRLGESVRTVRTTDGKAPFTCEGAVLRPRDTEFAGPADSKCWSSPHWVSGGVTSSDEERGDGATAGVAVPAPVGGGGVQYQ